MVNLVVQFRQLRSHEDNHDQNDKENPHIGGRTVAESDPLETTPRGTSTVRRGPHSAAPAILMCSSCDVI
jgi:hypothetical protein